MSTSNTDMRWAQHTYAVTICKAVAAALPTSASTASHALNLFVAENAGHLARTLQRTHGDINLSQYVALCLGVRRTAYGIDLQHTSVKPRTKVLAMLSPDAARDVPPASADTIPVYAECDGEYILLSVPLPPNHTRPSRVPSPTARRAAK